MYQGPTSFACARADSFVASASVESAAGEVVAGGFMGGGVVSLAAGGVSLGAGGVSLGDVSGEFDLIRLFDAADSPARLFRSLVA